jgi:hypothetical protein
MSQSDCVPATVLNLLPAVQDADDCAVQDADDYRTTWAVVVVTVAAWSSRCRGPGGRGWVRRRHGGARLRACEDPAGAVISARCGRGGRGEEPAVGDLADQRPR